MTELSPKGNLFDKSFDVESLYMTQLKSGRQICYTRRGPIWKDATACYWVTLSLLCTEDYKRYEDSLSDAGVIFSRSKEKLQFDVRYNEIGAIWEI